jgi:hypothetical protein
VTEARRRRSVQDARGPPNPDESRHNTPPIAKPPVSTNIVPRWHRHVAHGWSRSSRRNWPAGSYVDGIHWRQSTRRVTPKRRNHQDDRLHAHMLERERLQQCDSVARSSSAGAIKPAPTQIPGRPIPESSAVIRTRQRERGRDSPATDDPPGPASSCPPSHAGPAGANAAGGHRRGNASVRAKQRVSAFRCHQTRVALCRCWAGCAVAQAFKGASLASKTVGIWRKVGQGECLAVE